MKSLTSLFVVAIAMLGSSAAEAAVVIAVQEVGSDVVVSVSGTYNIGGANRLGSVAGFRASINNTAGLITGDTSVVANYYGMQAGPESWGSPYSLKYADSTTGDFFGFRGGTNVVVYLAQSYHGGAISSTSTYLGQTLASMHLASGQYLYQGTDSIALNIGNIASALPEPTTWSLMIGGFGMIGGAMRHKRITSVSPG